MLFRSKDEPSHQQVPWSKFKSSYLRVEGRTKPPASALVQNLSLSTYGWKDKPSHLRVSWSKFKVLLATGGRMNQVTYGCLGRSLKSYYLRVEGLTKPPASVLVQNLSPSTYGWKDEPSHSRVSWLKFKSFYLQVEG